MSRRFLAFGFGLAGLLGAGCLGAQQLILNESTE